MSDISIREVVMGEPVRRGLVDDWLMPAADRLADDHFPISNERIVREYRALGSLDVPQAERTLLKFEATCDYMAGPVEFNVIKAVMLTREVSQLGALAIEPDDEDVAPTDDEIDQDDDYMDEDIVHPDDFCLVDDEPHEIFAGRIVAYTQWGINSQTLQPTRRHDLLRYMDEEWISFQASNNFYNNPFVEEPNVALDDVIHDMTDNFYTYWDGSDVSEIRMALHSLGLRVSKRT